MYTNMYNSSEIIKISL